MNGRSGVLGQAQGGVQRDFDQAALRRVLGRVAEQVRQHLVQPVGVCALVSPWNVPFMTATWKVAPCLALGNTAVLKMSELSPLTADRLGELALEAGIPAGVLNLPVTGGLVALILAEKLLPGGHIFACATGLGLVAWGTTLLFP